MGRQEFCFGKGKFVAFSQLGLQNPGYSWARRRCFVCRLGWGLFLELLWVSRRPCTVAADRGALSVSLPFDLCPQVISTLPHPKHTSAGLHVSLFSTNKWGGCGSWERAVPQPDSHSIFSWFSISCFVYLFVFSNWPFGKNALVFLPFPCSAPPWMG